MIYYLMLALLMALAIPADKASRPVREMIAVLALLLFGGLRYEVGTDWFAYKNIFDAVVAGDPFSTFREEKGFLSLVLAVSAPGGGYSLFVFLLFALSLGIKTVAARLYGAELNATLLIYFSAIFLIYDVNGVRQGLAFGLVMLAGWAAYRRHAIRFIATITLASSVHMIALVALPMYGLTRPLLYVRNQLARAGLLLSGCALCYFTAHAIFVSSLSSYLEIVNLADRYNYYIDQFSTEFNPLGPGSLQRVLVALVVAFTIDSIAAPRRLKAFLYNAHAIALLAFFLFSFNIEFMARISYYYKCLDLITLPLILSAQTSPERRLLFLLFLGSLATAQAYQILDIPGGALLPYHIVL